MGSLQGAIDFLSFVWVIFHWAMGENNRVNLGALPAGFISIPLKK